MFLLLRRRGGALCPLSCAWTWVAVLPLLRVYIVRKSEKGSLECRHPCAVPP